LLTHRSAARLALDRPMWNVLKEFLCFIRQEKKWWLIPIVVILFALGALLILGAGSPLAPFIYSLF